MLALTCGLRSQAATASPPSRFPTSVNPPNLPGAGASSQKTDQCSSRTMHRPSPYQWCEAANSNKLAATCMHASPPPSDSASSASIPCRRDGGGGLWPWRRGARSAPPFRLGRKSPPKSRLQGLLVLEGLVGGRIPVPVPKRRFKQCKMGISGSQVCASRGVGLPGLKIALAGQRGEQIGTCNHRDVKSIITCCPVSRNDAPNGAKSACPAPHACASREVGPSRRWRPAPLAGRREGGGSGPPDRLALGHAHSVSRHV